MPPRWGWAGLRPVATYKDSIPSITTKNFRYIWPPLPSPLVQRRRGNSRRRDVTKLRCRCIRLVQMKTIGIVLVLSTALQIHASSADEWTSVAPREEIRPQFQQTESGGKSGHGAL